ncbi:MAG: hypothetical protein ABIH23_27310 [bacterium]
MTDTKTSILRELPNAEYPIEVTHSGKAQLKDGVFEEQAAPGSATKIRVLLGEERAAGDLNDDGLQDAAATLIADPGGSGTFIYLTAAINQNNTAKPVASVLLGDRIVVKSLTIECGVIIVTLLDRKPHEPMAATPTVEVIQKFNLRGDRLAKIE